MSSALLWTGLVGYGLLSWVLGYSVAVVVSFMRSGKPFTVPAHRGTWELDDEGPAAPCPCPAPRPPPPASQRTWTRAHVNRARLPAFSHNAYMQA